MHKHSYCVNPRYREAVIANATPFPGRIGRSKKPPVFSAAELAALKAANRRNLLRMDGKGKESWKVFIWDALKERARAAGKNPNAVVAPSERCLKWVRAEIAPAAVEARTQNARHRHVNDDYLTQVSMTGAFLALAWNGKLPEEGDTSRLLGELLFNTDGLSVLLKSDADVDTEVFADRDTLKELGVLKRQPARACGEDGQANMQDRTLHLHYTTSSTGNLVCTVLQIKDNHFDSLELLELEEGRLFLMLIPPSGETNEGGKKKRKWHEGEDVAGRMWTEAILPAEYNERVKVCKAAGLSGQFEKVDQMDCTFDADQDDGDGAWIETAGHYEEDALLDVEEDAVRDSDEEDAVQAVGERDETDLETTEKAMYLEWWKASSSPVFAPPDLKIGNLADGDSATTSSWMGTVI